MKNTLLITLFSIILVACGGEDNNSTTAPSVSSETIEVHTDEFTFSGLAAGDSEDPVVFFIHGFAATSYQFHKTMERIGAEGYYAVAFDMRGYSLEARPENVEDYNTPSFVQDVIDIADSMDIEQFHLVGHDRGAMIAWATAAEHSDRVLTVTPISVPHPRAFIDAFYDPNSEQAQMSAYAQDFTTPGYELEMLTNNGAELIEFYADIDMDYVDQYWGVVANEETMRLALNPYKNNDWAWLLALGPITMPTLFIWSDEDIYIAPEGAYATENYVEGDYTFVELSGVDHFIPEQEPDFLTEALLMHLNQ